MSAYEELVERCAREMFLDKYPDQSWTRLHDMSKNDYRGRAQAVLAEVLRTLETVTPGMLVAGDNVAYQFGCSCGAEPPDPPLSDQWLAMLRASPLAPK